MQTRIPPSGSLIRFFIGAFTCNYFKKAVCILLCILCFHTFSQNNKQDSLELLVKNGHDTIKVKALIELFNLFRNNEPEKSIGYSLKAIDIAKTTNFKKGESSANLLTGVYYHLKTSYDTAYIYYSHALICAKEAKDPGMLAKVYHNTGKLLADKGDYKKSIEYNINSLKIKEQINDQSGIASTYINMAIIYSMMNKAADEIKYYNYALPIAEKLNEKSFLGIIYSGLGNAQKELKNYDSALIYHNKALKIRQELQYKKGIAGSYINISKVYLSKSDYSAALKFCTTAIGIQESVNDKLGLQASNTLLGNIETEAKNYDKAVSAYQKVLLLALETRHLYGQKEAYNGLFIVYNLKGDHKNAFMYYELYSQIKDSLLNSENSKQIAEINVKYESEKKEKDNKILQTENALSQKTIKQQKTTTYFIITALALVIGIAFFIFRGLKQQRRANDIITAQKAEVENAKKIIEDQKELVEEKQKEVMDSIHYAQRIQQALLASESILNENLGGPDKHFVYFKPKDIVSGDFYWACSVASLQNAVGSSNLPTAHYFTWPFATVRGTAFRALL